MDAMDDFDRELAELKKMMREMLRRQAQMDRDKPQAPGQARRQRREAMEQLRIDAGLTETECKSLWNAAFGRD